MNETETPAETRPVIVKFFTRRRRIAAIAGCILAFIFWFALYIRISNKLIIERVNIMLPGLKEPFTAALIADLHHPNSPVTLDELAVIINGLAPGAVFSAGDAFEILEGNLEEFARFLKSLSAPFGVYAISGNWENQTAPHPETLKRAVDGSHTKYLINEAVQMNVGGQEITVVGLDDTKPDFSAVSSAPSGTPLIILAHCPVTFSRVVNEAQSPFVQLSGHTHGGQIAPFGLVLWKPSGSASYISGLYEHGRAKLYVTKGIGYSGLNIRIGARPELTFITFLPENR